MFWFVRAERSDVSDGLEQLVNHRKRGFYVAVISGRVVA